MKKTTLLLLLPSLILVGYFVYGFIGWNAVVSLSDWKGLTPSYNIVGFEHYSDLFRDAVFFTSLWNNVKLFLIFVPATLFMGLFLAVLLDQEIRGEGAFRTIYLLPFALSYVITGTLWSWMFSTEVGVINSLFRSIGLGGLARPWVVNPDITMYCIIPALIWQFSGYTMLIFLAGIKSIPESQIAAAKVDGARGFKLYRHVVIPQLKGPAMGAFVVLTIFALKAFDFIWVLTAGGPGYSSFVLPIMYYKYTFDMTLFAQGAAIASILLVLVLLFVTPYLYLTYRGGGGE